MTKIKLGIVGYGNLGKGVEAALSQNPDMELVAIFTRRTPSTLKTSGLAPVVSLDDILTYTDKIDVLILCGGSATDLPIQVPELSKYFNTVDSFDTHAKIPEFFEEVNPIALNNEHVSIISVGWDPGLFSLNRVLAESVLPTGNTYTFWGDGISQGHSDALRRIEGVADAKQYTLPVKESVELVRSGSNPSLTTREKHDRLCYVVLENGADRVRIEQEIKSMPNYFSDYNTTVHFISQEELDTHHAGMPHGGFVIRSGKSGVGDKQLIEFSLKLESNPTFTSSVLVAYARAAHRLYLKKDFGAKTVLDIPFSFISPIDAQDLRRNFL